MKFLKSITFCLLLISLLLSTLSSCKENGGSDMNNIENEEAQEFVMKAELIQKGEKLLVNVIEAEYASGDYLIIVPSEIEIKGNGTEPLTVESIPEGAHLRITYNGQVMMSLPPQVVAREIEIIPNE